MKFNTNDNLIKFLNNSYIEYFCNRKLKVFELELIFVLGTISHHDF